jgi:general secretion pathway protein K
VIFASPSPQPSPPAGGEGDGEPPLLRVEAREGRGEGISRETAAIVRRRRRQRGIVLVVVLWVLALLGIIAASFSRQTRVEMRVAHNLVENAKAEALADAGVERAMLGLIDPNEATVWRADGRPYLLALGEGRVRITLQDEAGKIDLNLASDEMLQGLFEAVGLSPGDAARMVDRVVDFRDPDDRRRPAGAEDPDYFAAGRMQGAKNAPFESVDELLQVLGMTREIYERAAPYLSVYSRRQVEPLSASPLVVEVLRRVAPEALARLRAAQAADAGAPRLIRPRIVAVTAEASTAGGGVFIREAILQRFARPQQPFRILEWRQRWPTLATRARVVPAALR